MLVEEGVSCGGQTGTILGGRRLLDDRWLFDNISRHVGDGYSSLFWKDPWFDGVSLDVTYARLFDLAGNKCATVAEMFSLGWEVNGEVWKWRMKLFA